MKRISILWLFVSLLSFTCYSQSVEWHPLDIDKPINVVGAEKDHYYILGHSNKSPVLMGFDMNHQLVSKKSIKSQYTRNSSEIKSIVTKDGMYAYFNTVEKNVKKLFCIKLENGHVHEVQTISMVNGVKKPSRYMSLSMRRSLYPYKNAAIDDLVVSEDKSYVAWVASKQQLKEVNKKDLEIKVFSSGMELKWQRNYTFPANYTQSQVKQVVVDNQGDVYIVARVENKDKPKKERLYFTILKVEESGLKEQAVSLGIDFPIIDMGLILNGGNENKIVGFYSSGKAITKIGGTFLIEGDFTNGFKAIKKHSVKENFGKELLSSKYIPYLSMGQVITFGDGSVGFVAEEKFYDHDIGNSDPFGGSKVDWVHAHNLLIVKIAKNGELTRWKFIEKEYSSKYMGYVYFSYINAENRHYLSFNASGKKNYDTKLLCLSNDLEEEYRTIASIKKSETGFYYIHPISNGKFFVCVEKDNGEPAVGIINLTE